MFVTSLSVPGIHLKCDQHFGASLDENFQHTWRILGGFALSISGVRSCGDYMFSGHTIVLTLLNFSITEYTPQNWKLLHIITYTANILGMFLILAAHEHYSIDVVIAFYISSRLFFTYHSLANSVALKGSTVDKDRLDTFFPLFSFLEEHTTGSFPNEYELPFSLSNFNFSNFFNFFKKKSSKTSSIKK